MKTRKIKPRSRGDTRSETSSEDQNHVVCPTCEGSGYLLRLNQQAKLDLNVINSKLRDSSRLRTGKSSDGYRLDPEYSPISLSCQSERSGSISPSNQSYSNRMGARLRMTRENSVRGRYESPSNSIKQIKAKFKDMSDEGALIEGLCLVVQLARNNSLAVKEHMSLATRALCALLRSHKASTIHRACEIITELFQMTNLVFRPEFDDLITLLMVKTGDLNQKVKVSASEALMVTATYAPANHLVRAVFAKGPNSKSPQVRLSAILALDRVVSEISPNDLFTSGGMRDARKKIIRAGCALLKDPNVEVRKVAKNMMLKLMEHEDFEDVLHTELGVDDYKKVEKSIICLKYGGNKSV